MKILKFQGHEIEYEDNIADDYFRVNLFFHDKKLAYIEVQFYDKAFNPTGSIKKDATQ